MQNKNARIQGKIGAPSLSLVMLEFLKCGEKNYFIYKDKKQRKKRGRCASAARIDKWLSDKVISLFIKQK
jgi:hypothetical protein